MNIAAFLHSAGAYLLLILHLNVLGQGFYNPKTYALKNNMARKFKIVKVVNDSAYLYYYTQANEMQLVYLPTGKVLAEIQFPYTFPRPTSSNYYFYPNSEGIVVINYEKSNDEVVFRKRQLNPRLAFTGAEKQVSIRLDRVFRHEKVEIREHPLFYEFLFMNGCTKTIGSFNNHYFHLLTVNKNLDVIDQYVYDGKNSTHINCLRPQDAYSNNIAYQLRMNYDDPTSFHQLLIRPDSTGKLRKHTDKTLKDHLNFIKVKDSAGTEYGYCFRLHSPEKNTWLLNMDSYEIKSTSKAESEPAGLKITKKGLLTRRCAFKNVSILCTKSIIEHNKVKLLTYFINDEPGFQVGTIYESIMGHAAFFAFENDSLLFKYHLPFHFARSNYPWGDMDIYMGSGEGKTIIAYNDDPEATDPSSDSDFENLPLVESFRQKHCPVFYRMIDGGGGNKSPLKDQESGEFLKATIEANNGIKTQEGEFYFPFLYSQGKNKPHIVKFAK